jgi:predicted small lipoprotein YifL
MSHHTLRSGTDPEIHLRRRSYTGLITLAVALASCGRAGPEPTVPPQEPEAPPTPVEQGPAPADAPDLMYLASTKDGTVYLEVPPEILADVRTELVRRGRDDAARQLGKLYDLKTGFVRDTAHAKAAEARLRRGKH